MPRRHNHLFDGIADFDALHAAAKRAILGKRRKPSAAAFFANLEGELLRLERQLHDGTYRPGRYVTIEVHDPRSASFPLLHSAIASCTTPCAP